MKARVSRTIDYQSSHAEWPRPEPLVLLAIAAGGVLIVLVTCIRIEVLNVQANYYLPRTDFDPTANSNKWRAWPFATPASFVPRERLRRAVASWGLANYPLSAFGGVLVAIVLKRAPHPRIRAVAWLFLVVLSACAALMFYRGYFTALGG